jgi:hypothetical protein
MVRTRQNGSVYLSYITSVRMLSVVRYISQNGRCICRALHQSEWYLSYCILVIVVYYILVRMLTVVHYFSQNGTELSYITSVRMVTVVHYISQNGSCRTLHQSEW